jgi:hypothetical protein
MPTKTTVPDIQHSYPGPLSGVDTVPLPLPTITSRFTGGTLVTVGARGGLTQLVNEPPVGADGTNGTLTASVLWTLAPVHGSFVKFHIDYSIDDLPQANGLVVVFEHRDFLGRPPLVVPDRINFDDLNGKGWNDLISSIVVVYGKWRFFSDNFTTPYRHPDGKPIDLHQGFYSWVEDVGIANDTISSFEAVL